MGFRVIRLAVWGLGLIGVSVCCFRVLGLEFWVWGLRFRVSGFGLGFRVLGDCRVYCRECYAAK